MCAFFLFADVQEVFDLFDFWDGRDGLVDAAKIGELLMCTGLNPTTDQVLKNGGESKMGSYQVRMLQLSTMPVEDWRFILLQP